MYIMDTKLCKNIAKYENRKTKAVFAEMVDLWVDFFFFWIIISCRSVRKASLEILQGKGPSHLRTVARRWNPGETLNWQVGWINQSVPVINGQTDSKYSHKYMLFLTASL